MSTNKDGFGAFSVKWIPYKGMIPTLATILYYIENHITGSSKISFAYSILKKWYWASVFAERYSGSPENTALEDVEELIDSIKDMRLPKMIDEAS